MKTTETIPAIPTEYRGHRFRSRLEARWACFFDNCGWPWEYEPIDLDGYIPDFVLTFNDAVLVEVKPVLVAADFDEHWFKIINSGWDKEALLLGAKIFKAQDLGYGWDNCSAIGQLRDEFGGIGAAVLQTCQQCKRISFYHGENSWACRLGHPYRGNQDCGPFSYEEGRSLFADCGGVVQYNT